MPKLFRPVRVEFDSLSGDGGYEHWVTTIRHVRRVIHADGWRWQLVRMNHKGLDRWDYCLNQDRECLDNLNWEFGLFR